MLFRSNRIISFSIQVNGADRRITFNPRMDGGSSYLSQDPDEQAALVRNEMCGRVYEPVNKEEAEALLKRIPPKKASEKNPEQKNETDEEVSEEADTPREGENAGGENAGDENGSEQVEEKDKELVCEAKSWQEAADYLSSQFGVSDEQLDTPDKILEQGKRAGVRFTKL